jgi:hypothetical protein
MIKTKGNTRNFNLSLIKITVLGLCLGAILMPGALQAQIFVTTTDNSSSASVGAVSEYSTSGTVINTSLATGLAYPTSIAVSGSDVFVTND